MAFRHHVAFSASRVSDADVVHHFEQLGYRTDSRAEGLWKFHRGNKSAAFWRFDIRAYDTNLVVRAKPQGTGEVHVSCDFDVWTFMSIIFAGDVATLEAEARALESALK
jgi:arginase family enzyme